MIFFFSLTLTSPQNKYPPPDFHPESWNVRLFSRFFVSFIGPYTHTHTHTQPAWSVSTVLVGLLSFMCEEKPTAGSIRTTTRQKIVFAKRSWSYNLKNKQFCKLFPEFVERAKERIESVTLDSDLDDEMDLSKSHHHVILVLFLGVGVSIFLYVLSIF